MLGFLALIVISSPPSSPVPTWRTLLVALAMVDHELGPVGGGASTRAEESGSSASITNELGGVR